MDESENERWGIPDWRTPEAYPPAWIYPRLFAWEFLRRNSEYRDAWLARRAVLAKAGIPDWIPGQKLNLLLTEETPAALWELNPPSLPGETLFAYERRIGYGKTYTQKWGGGALTSQWGYYAPDMIDPRRSAFQPHAVAKDPAAAFRFSFAANERRITVPGDLLLSFGGGDVRLFEHRDAAPEREDGEFMIVFDAREPLEGQLASAEKQLKKAQKLLERRGIATSEHPPKDAPSAIHLRILDGLAEGARISEIARVLHHGDHDYAAKKAADEKKNALFWRDEGWRRLMRITEGRRRRNRA